jgi:hypothetical protein
MNEPKPRSDALMARIKNHRWLSVLIVVGAIVIALASFTNATRALLGLIPGGRADVDGREIRFVMHTDNTFVDHAPIEFVARRDTPTQSPP